MQILLHTDTHTDGSHPMAEHLSTVVNHALGRFGDRVSRVEAHLSDADSEAKAGPDGIHCTLEARLPGLETIVVKDHADNAHQAIEGALRKLKRAVGAEIARHDPRGHAAQIGATVAEVGTEDIV
jgi:ribosome-associated translation inhibitor RaiA